MLWGPVVTNRARRMSWRRTWHHFPQPGISVCTVLRFRRGGKIWVRWKIGRCKCKLGGIFLGLCKAWYRNSRTMSAALQHRPRATCSTHPMLLARTLYLTRALYWSLSPPSLTFSHSLSVLTYPELSPWLCRCLTVPCASADLGFSKAGCCFGGGAVGRIGGGAISVSVSLPPLEPFSGSGDFSFSLFFASSVALPASSSATNQFIDHQRPAQRSERTMKWTLYVAIRRANRMNWSAAKLALVATRRVGVGPGMKMLFQRPSKKDAMLAENNAKSSASQVDKEVVLRWRKWRKVLSKPRCALCNVKR
jgi:hypothetical protein